MTAGGLQDVPPTVLSHAEGDAKTHRRPAAHMHSACRHNHTLPVRGMPAHPAPGHPPLPAQTQAGSRHGGQAAAPFTGFTGTQVIKGIGQGFGRCNQHGAVIASASLCTSLINAIKSGIKACPSTLCDSNNKQPDK